MHTFFLRSISFLLCTVSLAVVSAQESAPFELSGYTPDEIFAINDEQPLLTSDSNMIRLIDRVSRSSHATLRRFQKISGGASVTDLLTMPRDYRCHVVSLNGTAKFAAQIDDNIYLLHASGSAGNPFLVCINQLPQPWPLEQPINEPIGITGFFLANFDMPADVELADQVLIPGCVGIVPLVVAKQIEWFPIDPNSIISVKSTQRILAEHGVDIANMETVQPSGNLDDNDTILFYQMMAACKKINRLQVPASKQFTDCLKNPRDTIGDTLHLSGQLRRATKIAIDDPHWVSLLGQNHYFQLDLFVPLDEQQIVIRNPGPEAMDVESGGKIVHDNRYPIVVCVPNLPAPVDQIERKQVNVSGFFLKLWNYESGYSQQNPSAPKQISPLVIGLVPQVVITPPNPLNFWIGLATMAALLGAGFLFWFVKSESRKSALAKSQSNADLPDQIEIPSID